MTQALEGIRILDLLWGALNSLHCCIPNMFFLKVLSYSVRLALAAPEITSGVGEQFPAQ